MARAIPTTILRVLVATWFLGGASDALADDELPTDATAASPADSGPSDEGPGNPPEEEPDEPNASAELARFDGLAASYLGTVAGAEELVRVVESIPDRRNRARVVIHGPSGRRIYPTSGDRDDWKMVREEFRRVNVAFDTTIPAGQVIVLFVGVEGLATPTISVSACEAFRPFSIPPGEATDSSFAFAEEPDFAVSLLTVATCGRGTMTYAVQPDGPGDDELSAVETSMQLRQRTYLSLSFTLGTPTYRDSEFYRDAEGEGESVVVRINDQRAELTPATYLGLSVYPMGLDDSRLEWAQLVGLTVAARVDRIDRDWMAAWTPQFVPGLGLSVGVSLRLRNALRNGQSVGDTLAAEDEIQTGVGGTLVSPFVGLTLSSELFNLLKNGL
jgi:hypothetical protein